MSELISVSVLISEKRAGLLSLFKFKCNISEDPDTPDINVNTAATIEMIASGIGYSQFEAFVTNGCRR